MPDLDVQWGTRPPTVGTVANLRGVKGLDTLIEAAGIVRRTVPDVQFVVAGEGEQRAAWRAKLRQQGSQAGFS